MNHSFDKAIKSMAEKMIKPMDFCRMINTSLAKEGFKKNEIVLVVGNKVLPVSLDDPYTQRVYMFIQKFSDDKSTLEGKIYMTDPINLKKVGVKKQETLTSQLAKLVEEEPEIIQGELEV